MRAIIDLHAAAAASAADASAAAAASATVAALPRSLSAAAARGRFPLAALAPRAGAAASAACQRNASADYVPVHPTRRRPAPLLGPAAATASAPTCTAARDAS